MRESGARRRTPRARLGRRDNFRTDRDHLSQASLGAVDEDGGVDAGDRVEAGNNYLYGEQLAVFASESVSASRRRHAMCRWHAVTAHQRSGQQDSQIGLFETPMPTLILTLGCLTTLADPRGTSPSTVAILAH